jgi:hypothetical protein
MTIVETADTTSELLVASTFIISFLIGAKNGDTDSNMSALLVAGIGTISDYLADKYKTVLDPTASDESGKQKAEDESESWASFFCLNWFNKRIIPNLSLAMLTLMLIYMDSECLTTPVTAELLDTVMMISVMIHLFYQCYHGLDKTTYDEWSEKCEDYKIPLLWFHLILMILAIVNVEDEIANEEMG